MPNLKSDMPETIIQNKFREILINELPNHTLPADWEQNIVKLLQNARKTQNILIKETLQEIRNMYFDEMRKFNLKHTLTFLKNDSDFSEDYGATSTKYVKIENTNFLKNREAFTKHYFLSHKLIRNIIKISSASLPNLLFDIKDYNTSDVSTIIEISNEIKQDITRTRLRITKKYYLKVIRSMCRITELKSMEKLKLKSLLRCATVVLSQLLLNAMTDTINHLINSLQMAQNYPRMKLSLVYKQSEISLNPSLAEVFSTFHSIIDNITNMFQDLVPLEYWMKIDMEGYIKIKLPEWFVGDSHARLQSALESTFQTLSEHRESVNAQFSGIDATTITGIPDDLLQELRLEEFQVFCARVETLNEFFSRAKTLVDRIYFEVSTLSQIEASEHLQKYISNKTNLLLTKLISQHRNFARSIYLQFETLEARALDIPNETKPLFELCEYLSYASKVVVKELEEKIRRCVKMLSLLLHITTLMEDHMEINRKIVNKLWTVNQIFSQSNNLCESMKSVLEDELQRKVIALNAKVDQIVPELIILNDMDDVTRVKEYTEFLDILVKKVVQVEEEIQETNIEEKLFKFPETVFPKVGEIKEILLPFNSLVRLICKWRRDHAVWMNGPFENLKADEIERKSTYYHKELTQINVILKLKIKTDIVLSKAFKFAGIVDDPDPMQHPAPLKLCWQALRDINVFKRNVPLAICMCNKSLAKRHWDEMSTIAGFDLTPNARTTLGTIVDLNLFDDLHKYEVISVSANKELSLKNQLMTLIDEWNEISFAIKHCNQTGAFSFDHYNQIDSLLEDHTIKIESMKCSNFVYPIVDEVELFSMSLNYLRYCLDELPILFQSINEMQILFLNELIALELKDGNELYNCFVNILEECKHNITSKLSFRELFGTSELIDKIKEASNLLHELNVLVNKFIEDLRHSFPRFFFLTNKDILNIMDFKHDSNFRRCFSKCFSDLRLHISNDSNIHYAIGTLGEKIKLHNTINIDNSAKLSIIHWIISFEKEILYSIKRKILDTYNDMKGINIYTSFDILDCISETPGMIITCILKLIWTTEMEVCKSCSESKLGQLKSCYENQSKLKTYLINQLNSSVSNRCRLILITIIINLIHNGDFLKKFIQGTVPENKDFLWEMQLKYYLSNEDVRVSTMMTFLNYGYEYYSIQKPGIIPTTLTERSYHSLIIAYKNNLSSAIVGPNNSGKKETFKSLAHNCALLFYILDCKTNFDYNFIKQILTGFILRGPWLCLKNFCCIKLEFYSIIGRYISNINAAKNAKSEIVHINEIPLKLNTSGFVCTTINPACTQSVNILDETRRNFRTVSMMQPDEERIIEVYLTSTGFIDAKNLTIILKTISSYFNKQYGNNSFKQHFNLNSTMRIIDVAYHRKLRHPNLYEKALILRTLIDIYIPKLNENEIRILQHLIRDTLSDIVLPQSTYLHLLDTTENICRLKSLSISESFKLKIIQMFEMMHFQRILIITGGPFAGKTSLLRVLGEALSSSHKSNSDVKFKYNIKMHSLNQNTITLDRFYDFLNDSTWINANQVQNWNWFVFDGNLSDTFYETLQALLDNKSSFLTSYSEKLSNINRMSIILETSDLRCISPSFVAKCNIINVDNRDCMSDIKHEIQERYNTYEDFMYTLIEWSISSCLQFLNNMCSNIINVSNNQLILSTWKLFKSFIDHAFKMNNNEKDIKRDYVITWCQAAVIMSTVWGLGGSLQEQSQTIFDTFCVSLWTGSIENCPYPKQIKPFDNFNLNERQLREYFYVFKGTGTWKYCGDALKGETIVENPLGFRDAYVPTVDTIRYTTILQYNIQNRQPFILCSDSPSGKSAYLKYFFDNKILDVDYNVNYYHAMSTMPLKISEEYILSKMSKLNYKKYNKDDKLSINFIDDLHLCLETNGSTPTLELMRQYLDHGCWYNTNNFEQIALHNAIFCAAFTSPNKKICNRFLRHFSIYAVHPPSKDNMFRIFTNILLSNLKKNLFASDVLSSVNNIINATLTMYTSILNFLKPVPSKFQYLFDLRDVCRIISCCSLIEKDSVESKVTLLRLWVHEIFRVFGDKIMDDLDKNWLFVKIKEIIKSQFKESFENAFDHLPKGPENEVNKDSLKQLFFGNLIESDKETDSCMKYEEINSLPALKNKIIQYVNEYNENNNEKMDITITNNFVENLVKLCRILRIPGGNLLMISNHGSGRRTLTLLASFIQKQKFVEISIGSSYNVEGWKSNLKDVLIACGCSEKKITFLCKDRQMNDEYLCNVSSLIKHGEIPQLFSKIEWQEIIKKVRLLAQNGDRNMELPIDNIKEYFTRQCRENLHFIICLNPSEIKHLKTFFQNYSNLTSCCYTDWHENWPQEALQQVAVTHFKTIKSNEETKKIILKACTYFYSYIKNNMVMKKIQFHRNYVPVPAMYIRMAKLFLKNFIEIQQPTLKNQIDYKHGLEKLEEAALRVKQMKIKLVELCQQLEISSQETEATMKEIEKDNASIESATMLVKADEETANKKADIAAILKTECETDLAIAIPILEDAVAALNTLKPTDITLVKAMKNPPDTIKLVMAAVCVMLEIPADRMIDPASGKKITDYWSPSKRILGDMNFLQILKDYDKDNISPSVMQTIQRTYMTDATFQPRIVAKASSAAEGLCKWVRAMVSYDKVAKVVTPKKEKLAIAINECNLAESYLNEKRKALADLNNKLSALKNTLKIALTKKEQLESEVKNCNSKLEKAEHLITSLLNEKERWIKTSKSLQQRIDHIVGDVLLISGVVTYLGPFNSMQRNHIIKEWHKIIKTLNLSCSSSYNIIDLLRLELKVDTWIYDGLSADNFSLENAVIVEKSLQWAYLFIDPLKVGNSWIKNTIIKRNDFMSIKISDEDFVNVLQNNIEIGTPVLIENIDSGDLSYLISIISQPVYNDSEKLFMNFNNKIISYNLNFKMYIISKHYQLLNNIDVYNKITVIDFTINKESLQDQLSDILIARERPQFYDKFKDTEAISLNNKEIIKTEENKILRILSASKDIIEDESAINMLVESKNVFQQTVENEKNYNQLRNEMNQICINYKPFTKFASDLYCTVNSLHNFNYIYNFSITWFISLYKRSLETSNRSSDFEKLLNYFKLSLLKRIHISVRKSLFEKHKMVYSFLTALNIQLDAKQITREEINTFMTINLEIKTASEKLNPAHSWLPERLWQQICFISNSINEFRPLINSFITDTSSWKSYYESHDFYEQDLPEPWNNLSTFKKLIIVRILSPDKTVYILNKFISESIGDITDFDLQTTVANAYLESSCVTPIMFLLPSYSSPLSAVSNHAKLIGCSFEIINVYLNQESTENDFKMLLEKARINGYWIFVHNCQLLSKLWLKKLDKMCDNFEATDTSLEFRLWLSTSVTENLPSNIVEKSVKVAYDNPSSFKQYFLSSYSSELLSDNKLFCNFLHNLFFFHAIICERKTFGFRSWNVNYEFEESDLQISVKLLSKIISNYKDTTYEMLSYVLGKCIYGGKVMDNFDENTLDVVLNNYCHSNVEKNEKIMQIYTVPIIKSRKDWTDFIKQHLSDDHSTTLVGFDKTARIIRNNIILDNITDQLFQVEDTISQEYGEIDYKENFVKSTMQFIKNSLTIIFDVHLVREKYPLSYQEPYNNILYEETMRYNEITGTIISSLIELENFYHGHNARKQTFEELERQMYYGEIPLTWKMNSTMRYTERSLPVFIAELCERLSFIKNWIDNGHPPIILLRALTIPSVIFVAIKLKFSRNNAISINKVMINYAFADEYQQFAENEVTLSEIYLSGATWNKDNGMLCETPSKIIHNVIPRLCLKLSFNYSCVKFHNQYNCPLYISSVCRNKKLSDLEYFINYIHNIKLDSMIEPQYWTRIGTALYCDVK